MTLPIHHFSPGPRETSVFRGPSRVWAVRFLRGQVSHMMRSLATFAAGAAAAAVIVRENRARRAAERFAGAALETLLNAVDANDAQTGAHVRRVATFALIIADAAGLDRRQRRTVEQVALFHDIGKIHEALFDIVHEDTGLTPEARRAIATHP